MANVTINGKEITVPKGTPIIRAAAMLGFNIPHFCYHPALSAPANCRMCLVEVERARKLEPSCYLKCTDGMVVHTETEKVQVARRSVLEFILINHPVDCPICDQAGECKLQDYYMAYDAKPSRLRTQKVGKAKALPLGPQVIYDGERCILCTRCVRFCDEITGTSELTVVERGDRSEIRTFPGAELDNAYSMNVTDICPVGALTTRDFRFKCRVWLLSSTDSICVGCSRGCNVHLEHHLGETQRYRPRFNPEVNEYWMCDEGRLSYKRLHTDRLTKLRIDDDRDLSWPRAARSLAGRISEATAGGRVAFVASAGASTEGLYAAREYASRLLGDAVTYWSGRPDGDADEFLIRADKNPNRRGVFEVFGADIAARDTRALLAAIEAGEVDVLYMMGSDLALDDAERTRLLAALSKVSLFILQAPNGSALAEHAHVVLPATTHAEHDGTWINEDGIVQEVWKAYDAPGQCLPDWQIFVRMARGADVDLGLSDVDAIRAALYSAHAAE